MRTSSITYREVLGNSYRFDPSFHISEATEIRSALNNLPYGTTMVSSSSDRIFIGNIFSRVFVKEPSHGVPYLAASDTVLSNLDTGLYLSKSQASDLSYLMLNKDWILVTCSGTIGKVTYTNSNFCNRIATHDLVRIVPNDNGILRGCLYSFLASKYGYYQLTQSKFGGVVKHINADHVKEINVPVFPKSLQETVDLLIKDSAKLREDALALQNEAYGLLIDNSGLMYSCPQLEEYDYYGPRPAERIGITYSINRRNISGISINAFNYSARIMKLKERIERTIETKPLINCIDQNGLFSTGSFPRVEVKPGHGIELINQRDIFDSIVRGKNISRRGVKTDNLVEENEIIIAGVGTLGESETFCRCVYANKYLAGKLISGEFIRMKSSSDVPSGYLFTWLNSPYGFRLIRNTQAGTKLCRPIPKLLERIPVPILSQDMMLSINDKALSAQVKLALAASKELEAISLVEHEIERWSN